MGVRLQNFGEMRDDDRGAIHHRVPVDFRILLFGFFNPHRRQPEDRLLTSDTPQLHATARYIHRHPAPHHEGTTPHDPAAQQKTVLATR